MPPSLRHIRSILLLASAVALSAGTAAQSKLTRRTLRDASWTKAYATGCPDYKSSCNGSKDGYENAFNGDPRLPELLKRSLPQHESWWVNGRAGFAPVSSIVQEFIGVPGGLLVDDNRYVTATGCVPHDCGDGGMLWIDAGSHPAGVVFIAHISIESLKGGAGDHLWLFASRPLDFEALPPDLLANLRYWHARLVASAQKLPPPVRRISSQGIAVATLVQPDGRMQDLTYDMLFYKDYESKHWSSGAKQ